MYLIIIGIMSLMKVHFNKCHLVSHRNDVQLCVGISTVAIETMKSWAVYFFVCLVSCWESNCLIKCRKMSRQWFLLHHTYHFKTFLDKG